MRAAILAAVVIAACVSGAPALAQSAGQSSPGATTRIAALQPFIAEAARRFSVPQAWIRAVIAAESGGRTELDGRPITSSAGAMGPMQVMPETYADMRQRYGLGADPYDPEQNILAGTAYLAELYRRFGRDGIFAAYNAGPDRYQQFLDTGDPLPAETVAYLATLGVAPPASSIAQDAEPGGSLFFALNKADAPASTAPVAADNCALFVPLNPPNPASGAGKWER
jgi:soluble lytic murein transglycosylase-like protein